MLHVLDPDSIGAAEENRIRVRSVDDVVDLDSRVLRLGEMLVGGVDQDCEVVQERPLGIARLAGMELDERTTDLEPRLP